MFTCYYPGVVKIPLCFTNALPGLYQGVVHIFITPWSVVRVVPRYTESGYNIPVHVMYCTGKPSKNFKVSGSIGPAIIYVDEHFFKYTYIIRYNIIIICTGMCRHY